MDAPPASTFAPAPVEPIAPRPTIDTQAPETLGRLRRAAAAVIHALGEDIRTPADLSRALGVDRSLAWRVWRLGLGPEPIPDARHIPGKVAFDRFLRAAVRAGTDERAAAALRSALDDFATLAKAHARDRPTIDVLINALSGESDRTLTARRALYRASREILGVQARARYQLAVVFPGPKGFQPDVALVRTFHQLVRTRPHRAWLLGRSTMVQHTGPVSDYTRSPIQPGGAGPGGIPLLPAFCSTPLPPARRLLVPPATFEDELGEGPIGESHAVDVTLAERISNIPWDATGREAITMDVRTPCEWACLDVLLHRDCVTSEPPAARWFTLVNGEHPFTDPTGRDELSFGEPLRTFDSPAALPPVACYPRGEELIAFILKALDLESAPVRAHRLVVALPPVPVTVSIDYPLNTSTRPA
jgi:hypothetical protein